MGDSCSMPGKDEKYMNFSLKGKGRDHF